MLMLALPMVLLFLVSEVVARLMDRRRGRRSFDGLDDDEASDIEASDHEVRRSGLSEDED
jgi:sec-independent protein translocase protein TatC